MKFDAPLVPGTLIRRYKRFLADIRLDDGRLVTAHCPNPGSMKTCATPGWRVYVSSSDNPRRKLQWTWELAYDDDDHPLLIHTGRGNRIVEDGIRNQRIPSLRGYSTIQREVSYGKERSRIDLLLSEENRPHCYVEVKNVTMLASQGTAAFPDSVTKRGTKHLRELMAMVEEGHRAALVFLVPRGGISTVRPADEIDPVYGQTLRAAKDRGVEIVAHSATITTAEITLGAAVPIRL